MHAALALLVSLAWADPGENTYREQLEARVPFEAMATTEFAPVYPALAREIVQDYGITEGRALDVGGGTGHLAVELARRTDLRLYVVDIDPWSVRLAHLVVDDADLTGRVVPVQGRAEELPFRDGWFNLVVSRGSIFFWEDQLAGLLECWRVLAPGGVARVGGGFSRLLPPEVRDPLVARARARLARPDSSWRPLAPDLVEKLEAAGVTARVFREPEMGWWVELRKPDQGEGPPSR